MFDLSVWKDIAISVLGGLAFAIFNYGNWRICVRIGNWLNSKFGKSEKEEILVPEPYASIMEDMEKQRESDVKYHFVLGAFLGAMSVFWAAFCQRRFGYV